MSELCSVPSGPTRSVICCDALDWLKSFTPSATAVLVGSLPDYSEFPNFSLEEWQNWFIETSQLIHERTHPTQVSIFFQSDVKHDGRWIDKAFLTQKAAERINAHLLSHKIYCRLPAGQTSFGRPGYSHLLCFSKELRVTPLQSSADVIPHLGKKTWARGMGFEACRRICEFARDTCKADTIINPFCGQGSLLAVANAMGLNAVGIERSHKRAAKAKTIEANLELEEWHSF
jgi:hypothetical protein